MAPDDRKDPKNLLSPSYYWYLGDLVLQSGQTYVGDAVAMGGHHVAGSARGARSALVHKVTPAADDQVAIVVDRPPIAILNKAVDNLDADGDVLELGRGRALQSSTAWRRRRVVASLRVRGATARRAHEGEAPSRPGRAAEQGCRAVRATATPARRRAFSVHVVQSGPDGRARRRRGAIRRLRVRRLSSPSKQVFFKRRTPTPDQPVLATY